MLSVDELMQKYDAVGAPELAHRLGVLQHAASSLRQEMEINEAMLDETDTDKRAELRQEINEDAQAEREIEAEIEEIERYYHLAESRERGCLGDFSYEFRDGYGY